jgi:hypothetical protein
MKKLDTTPALFTPENAEAIARMMTETDDEGWTYEADHDPKGTGYSRVKILDEDGEFVSFWSA